MFERGGTVKKDELPLHNATIRGNPDALEIVGLPLDLGAPINMMQFKDDPEWWAMYTVGFLSSMA